MGSKILIVVFFASVLVAGCFAFLPGGLAPWGTAMALAVASWAFLRLWMSWKSQKSVDRQVMVMPEERLAEVPTAEALEAEDFVPAVEGADEAVLERGRLAEEALLLLPFLSRIIAAVPRKTEEAAFALMEKFQKVRNLVEEASEAAATVSTGEGLDKNVAMMSERSRDSMAAERSAVAQIVDLSRQNARNLRDMSGEISSGIQLLSDIEEIAQKSHLIALNLSIEAAHIGKQGLGFKVIASELRNLNDKTTEFSKQVSDLLNALRERNAAVFSEMAEKSDAVVREVECGMDLTARAVESLIEASGASRSLSTKMASLVARIHGEMDGILEALQFQDITRQMLEGAGFIAEELVPLIERLKGLSASVGALSEKERSELFQTLRSRLLERAKTKGEKEAIMEVMP